MRLLRSLEEFLYELVGWLVFYPRTFWRILRHPGAIAPYTRAELARDPEQQFSDTISPVLMLILSVAVAHALELAFRMPAPALASPVGRLAFGSEEGLLLSRSVVFCTYAFGAALGTMRRKRTAITRDTLREPFSVQAFLVCPFLVLVSAGSLLARAGHPHAAMAGLVLVGASVAWYLIARTAAYRALHGGGWLRPLASVCAWFVATTVVILAVAALLLL